MSLMLRFRRAIAEFAGVSVLWIPGRVGCSLRSAYYRARGAKIGRRARIDLGVIIDSPQHVIIGDDTWVDRFVILIAGPPRSKRETRILGSTSDAGRLVIGDRCHIGPNSVLSGLGGLIVGHDVTASAGTKIYSLSHHYRSWARPWDRSVTFGSMGPVGNQSMLQGAVRIGPNVGIGADVLVLPGTSIAGDSFVRPRSVVSGDWPANSILAGDPAARTGPRFSEPPSE
jgi:acetyltransferase-like isoleucine patch superfamily enzyme